MSVSATVQQTKHWSFSSHLGTGVIAEVDFGAMNFTHFRTYRTPEQIHAKFSFVFRVERMRRREFSA